MATPISDRPGPATAAPLVEVRDLTVWYRTDRGPLQVLDGINLSIAPGEVVGLVGESGCGKSTLGKTVMGSLPKPAGVVRNGSVTFDGIDLINTPEAVIRQDVRGRAITTVPQDPFGSLDPLFRIGTQLSDLMRWKSPDRPRGESGLATFFSRYPRARRMADQAAVLRMLADVQIPNPDQALRKLPGELSGGQRQRLMIAMALLPEPRMIVADEPTTALDVTIQAQILKLLQGQVRQRGVSVLFTTHDLGVASEICDRITVMYAGQEVESAPTAAFFERPSHPYAAKLVASLPKGRGRMRDIPGELPSLFTPPTGCRFQTRCERATAVCSQVRPPPRDVTPGHVVRCHHPIEVAA